MKRFFVLTILLPFCIALLVKAEGPDGDYVKIYNLISEGDQFSSTGQPDRARDAYTQAQSELKKLLQSYPKWNEQVIQFRLDYLSEKLKGSAPAKAAPATRGIAGPSTAQSAQDEKDRQMQTLAQEVQQLKQEKTVLEAKLKEALSARPLAVDPRELTKAEERIKLLEKEKELLKVSLEQAQNQQTRLGDTALVEDLKRALADANKKVNEHSERLVQIAREKEILEIGRAHV